MDERFRIYVERLRSGNQELIDESFTPDFFDLNEEELSFKKPIHVKGKAYLANDDLFIQLNIETEVTLPCAICNEKFNLTISIHDFYYSAEAEEFKAGFFDYKNLLRDTILLEIPYTSECSGGQCPGRERLKNYISKEKKEEHETESYFPFSGL